MSTSKITKTTESDPILGTFLATRLNVPLLRPDFIPRPHLVKKLDDGTKGLFTLISAPAGFGKTTLLSEWIHQSDMLIAWLSMEKDDNDPIHFIRYLLAALQKIDINIGGATQSMLQSAQQPPIESIVTTLINEIVTFSDEIVLFLDDYHVIENKQIQSIIEIILKNIPTNIHLVICTRSDPPFPLALMRSKNTITELRITDLCFSLDETSVFFRQVMNLDLSLPEVNILNTKTEGWIAGLQLAALTMLGRKETSKFIESFSGDDRYIVDYLTEEVLTHQSEAIRNFLLQTSILNRFTGSLCDSVMLRANSQEILDELDKINLFIIPLDNKRQWYRYHHLFSDLLQKRLQQNYKDLIPELHIRASKWYGRNGIGDKAINHAIIAEDFKLASQFINEFAEDTWQKGNHSKLMKWFDILPQDLRSSMPNLCIYKAWMLVMEGKHEESEQWCECATKALDAIKSKVKSNSSREDKSRKIINFNKLYARIAIIRSVIASFNGDHSGITQFSNQAKEYLPDVDSSWQCLLYLAIGDMFTYKGDGETSNYYYSEAVKYCRTNDNLYLSLICNLVFTHSAREFGRLNQAFELTDQMLKHIDETGFSNTEYAGWIYATKGDILYERNEINKALQYTTKGVELAESGNTKFILGWIYTNQIKILFGMQDIINCKKAIVKLEKIINENQIPPRIVSTMSAYSARLLLLQGDLDSASEWIKERKLNINDEITFSKESEYIVLARILLAQGKIEGLDQLLKKLMKNAQYSCCIVSQIEILLIQSRVFKSQGKETEAIAAMVSALSIAEPEGFIRIFIDDGSNTAELLKKIIEQNEKVSIKFINRILSAIRVDSDLKQNSRFNYTLSKREFEVLRLIESGLTNNEISGQLFISLNTVKTHVKNINSKLGVESRNKAVIKAKAENII